MKIAVNAGFALAVLILVLIGLICIGSMQRLIASQQWVAHTYDVRLSLLSLSKDVSDAASGRRAYILTGDRRYLERVPILLSTLDKQLDDLRRLVADNPRQVKRLNEAEQLIRARIAGVEASLAARDARPSDMASQRTFTKAGSRLEDQLRLVVTDMTSEERRLLAARLDDQKKQTDGAVFAFLLGLLLSIGMLSAIVLILRKQVLRRSQAESELAVKSGTLQAILSSMSDGVVVADRNGAFLHYNEAAKRLTGRSSFDAAPEAWSDEVRMFRTDGVTPLTTSELPLLRAMRGERVEAEELFIARTDDPNGGVWLELSAAPLRTADDNHIGGVVVMRDATERRHVQEQIERLNSELQVKVTALQAVNAELESFSYSVSHDLRSPLRSLDGFSQALMEDYADALDEQGMDFLARIRAAAQRMGRLIDDMLVLSRATRREMAMEPLNLSAKAALISEELRSANPARRVEVVIEEGIQAVGDRQLIRAVLDNLIGNAWKFTSKTANARIEFGAITTESGELACFVRDNGAGFDAAYAHKLFGAFQRLHAMEDFPGTGVGLATVQRIILRHGGRVWAEGKEGEGATFYFVLPGLSVAESRPSAAAA